MNESPSRRRRNRPRLRTLDVTNVERHASWLELFFDLVFVLAVARVAHVLVEHSDLYGFLKYAALFAPTWWAWVGYTFYANRFESEETAYRVLTFTGMLTVAAFSLTLENAFSPAGDAPFVICYVLMRLALVVLYLRSAYHIPLARAFSLQFVAGLGVSSILWLASLWLAAPGRYAIWALAFALELATPLLNLRTARILPIDRSHIPERFGLFTIIVLGEAVIATANGAARVEWNAATVAAAAIGFAMAACVWWINFDFVEDSALRSDSLVQRFVYLYGHLLIVGSIIVIGIGVEHTIKETATEAHLHFPTLALLAGGIAAYLAVITIIRLVTNVCHLIYPRVAAIVAALSLLYLGYFLPPLVVLAALCLIFVAEVWAENFYSDEEEAAAAGEEEEKLSPLMLPCAHAAQVQFFAPREAGADAAGCEECVANNYKWVHLRLCTSCGHVGCCDSSRYKHATAHFRESRHPIIASLETGENWAWCYEDERFVPFASSSAAAAAAAVVAPAGNESIAAVE